MKKTISIISIAAMIASMTACGAEESSTSKSEIKTEIITEAVTEALTEQPFDTEAFKNKVSAFNDTVYAAGVLLSNGGRYEANYMKSLKSFGDTPEPSDVSKRMVNFLLEKSDPEAGMTETKLEDDYNAICKEYMDIKAADNGSQELSAIRDEYEALFNGYASLYGIVTDPPVSTFSSEYNEQVEAMENANSKLNAFLK